MIWGDVIKNEDSSPRPISYQDADDYCKSIGASLATGYLQSDNGKNGFPKEDSDFVRLSKYMGVTYDDAAQNSGKNFFPQVLPNFADKIPDKKVKGSFLPRRFWSASTFPVDPKERHIFIVTDSGGGIGAERENQRVLARCAFRPKD